MPLPRLASSVSVEKYSAEIRESYGCSFTSLLSLMLLDRIFSFHSLWNMELWHSKNVCPEAIAVLRNLFSFN